MRDHLPGLRFAPSGLLSSHPKESHHMRIMFLNQAPSKSAAYEAAKIEAQLNTYASPGTKVEIVFPDEYEGSQLYDTICAQRFLNYLHQIMDPPSIVRTIFWPAQNRNDAGIS